MFVSKAQINKFYDLHKKGLIGSETIARWSMGVKLDDLPERVDK